jgi:hypothetical protein
LSLCECCSWEIPLNIGLGVSFGNRLVWKGIREKADVTNDVISRKILSVCHTCFCMILNANYRLYFITSCNISLKDTIASHHYHSHFSTHEIALCGCNLSRQNLLKVLQHYVELNLT